MIEMEYCVDSNTGSVEGEIMSHTVLKFLVKVNCQLVDIFFSLLG